MCINWSSVRIVFLFSRMVAPQHWLECCSPFLIAACSSDYTIPISYFHFSQRNLRARVNFHRPSMEV